MILGPIFVMGLSALVSGYGLTKASFNSPTLDPTMMGMGQNKVFALAGVAAAALFSGPLALVGAGVAVGSILAETSRRDAKAGIDAMMLRQTASSAALPGPAAMPEPRPETRPEPGGMIRNLLSPFWAQPNTNP